jgi:hypothetical protein
MANGPLAPEGTPEGNKAPEGKRVSNPANFYGSKFWGARRSMLTGRLKAREAQDYAIQKRKFEEQQEKSMDKAKDAYKDAQKAYKSDACVKCREAEVILRQNRTMASYLLRKNLGTGSTIFNKQANKVDKAKIAERDAKIALLEKQIKTAEKDKDALNTNSNKFKTDFDTLEASIKEKKERLETLKRGITKQSWFGSLFGTSKKTPISNIPNKGQIVAIRTETPMSRGTAPQQDDPTGSSMFGGGFTRRSSLLRRKNKRTRRH